MNLHKLILTQNNCYKAGAPLIVTNLMLHSTGANNPYLRRYVGPDDGRLGVNAGGNHWNTPKPSGINVCVHGFIGKLKDGSVATYQTLPWGMRGWHAGGSANNTHIGIEICEDGLTDPVYFAAVYREAVEVFAMLCKEFGLNPYKNIICHSEGHRQGIASNHADVMHWFPKYGKSMDTFRADVAAEMEDDMTGEQIYNKLTEYCRELPIPEWAREEYQQAVEMGLTDGTRPMELVPRFQAAIMAKRAVRK